MHLGQSRTIRNRLHQIFVQFGRQLSGRCGLKGWHRLQLVFSHGFLVRKHFVVVVCHQTARLLVFNHLTIVVKTRIHRAQTVRDLFISILATWEGIFLRFGRRVVELAKRVTDESLLNQGLD